MDGMNIEESGLETVVDRVILQSRHIFTRVDILRSLDLPIKLNRRFWAAGKYPII